MKSMLQAGAAALALLFAAPTDAAPAADGAMLNRITDQAFNHGEVLDLAEHLDDRIGGRMTNSPAMREAERWTQARFRAWGLSDVHAEGFDFGRGWWIERSDVRMVAPRPLDLRAIPVAWTPPTKGAVTAPVIVAPIANERDFAEWKGKLAGKIVLVSFPAPPRDDERPPFRRLTSAEIDKLDAYPVPETSPERDARFAERFRFARKLDAFLASDGALAWAKISYRDGRRLQGEGYAYQAGQSPKLPGVEIAAEDYRRLARLAKTGEVKLSIDSNVHYDDSDHRAYDVLADLPGRTPEAGYVMAGAHLDSWVAGDGAADNGAGVVVVMEAARILKALDVHPKRTIRFALWAGEEQGLLGSWAYVNAHLAKRPADPKTADLGPYFGAQTYPVEPLPGYRQLAAYFNLDNGSGKIRGVYAEGNFAAAPVLREWMSPLSSLGASRVVADRTGSTDHVFMARAGLPAFQFIQDPLDYGTVVHHSDLDTYDHLRGEDLRQAAAVLAAMLLDAADADAPLPRAVLPTEPKPTDPFEYADPSKK